MAVQQSLFNAKGLQYDRRWMLIDKNNHFITQRTHRSLVLLQAEIKNDQLVISHKQTQQYISIALHPQTSIYKPVVVWDDTCQAVIASPVANEWLSSYLNEKVELVFMPEETNRLVDKRYVVEDTYTSFTDGYSFLVISEASLEELNSLARTDFTMDRFRPSIVVSGSPAQQEEQWCDIKMGNHLFKGVKPCARCVVTTINQQTAAKGKEPLQTLATYKRNENRILFGQNLVYTGSEGNIAVGDEVNVLSMKEFSFF